MTYTLSQFTSDVIDKESPMSSNRPFAGCLMLVALTLVPAAAEAQSSPEPSPYSGLERREIKALSADEIDSYLSGSGMGFALAAELNGYPGPKHVLELREELGLSGEQVLATEQLFGTMKSAAEVLGRQIVDREAELDRLFSSHGIDSEELAVRTRVIGELEGQLRAVHLDAHLQMIEILEHEQVRKYIELRGYHGGAHPGHHSPASHGGSG